MKLTNSEKVKRWRRKSKERIIESMGGCCQVCGYNKCNNALALHHLNPEEKDFGFGSIRANPKSWDKIVSELRKCVLVCHNCHSEIHEGITVVPETAKKFDEKFVDYRTLEKKNDLEPCPMCGVGKSKYNIYCSKSCAAKSKGKIDWDNIDLINLYEKHKKFSVIADILGVSDVSVSKRYKKILKENNIQKT